MYSLHHVGREMTNKAYMKQLDIKYNQRMEIILYTTNRDIETRGNNVGTEIRKQKLIIILRSKLTEYQ